MNPRLAVAICTYNNASLLARTLEHLELQRGANPSAWEVAVIANRCTDNTAEVVEEFIARQRIPRLRLIHEDQQGQGYARMRAMSDCAEARYIAWVDDDNYLTPDWVAEALRFGETHPMCGAWGGRVEIFWETAPAPIFRECAYAYAALDLESPERQLHGEDRWKLRGAGLICLRDALRDSGCDRELACVGRSALGTMAGDDLEMLMRIASAGYELWWTPRLHLHHFITTRRISFRYLRKLHLGFGLAHPILLRAKRRLTPLGLTLAMTIFSMKRTLRLLRIVTAGRLRRLPRQRALLEWDYIRGSLIGLSSISQHRSTNLGPSLSPTESAH